MMERMELSFPCRHTNNGTASLLWLAVLYTLLNQYVWGVSDVSVFKAMQRLGIKGRKLSDSLSFAKHENIQVYPDTQFHIIHIRILLYLLKYFIFCN